MLDSRKSDPNCSFAENVVSYLYDEMPRGEKLEFEQHLHGCLSCGEELGAFSVVSNSIQTWRDAEFAGAQAPQISRSLYELESGNVDVEQNEGVSWLTNLRRLFDLSPVMLKSAAAFGTIAILIGMGWIMFGGVDNASVETAKTPEQTSNPVIEKENVAVSENERAANDEANVAQIDDSIESTQNEGSMDVVGTPNNAESTATERIAQSKQRSSTSKNRVSNNSERKTPDKKQNSDASPVFKEVPRLTNEVAVDDSEDLRLSDIFSEIGS